MKKIILSVLVYFVCSVSSASILLEPYLGYTMGELDDGSSTYDANGMAYGVRLGYEVTMLWFALDYQMTAQDVAYSSGDRDGEASRLGVVVGATLPLGIRAWGGYYIKDEFEIKSTSSTNEYDGMGMKMGVGFRLVPLLHLNFEYLMSKYDEYNGYSLASDDEVTGFFVTLSVPLSI